MNYDYYDHPYYVFVSPENDFTIEVAYAEPELNVCLNLVDESYIENGEEGVLDYRNFTEQEMREYVNNPTATIPLKGEEFIPTFDDIDFIVDTFTTILSSSPSDFSEQ